MLTTHPPVKRFLQKISRFFAGVAATKANGPEIPGRFICIVNHLDRFMLYR